MAADTPEEQNKKAVTFLWIHDPTMRKEKEWVRQEQVKCSDEQKKYWELLGEFTIGLALSFIEVSI